MQQAKAKQAGLRLHRPRLGIFCISLPPMLRRPLKAPVRAHLCSVAGVRQLFYHQTSLQFGQRVTGPHPIQQRRARLALPRSRSAKICLWINSMAPMSIAACGLTHQQNIWIPFNFSCDDDFLLVPTREIFGQQACGLGGRTSKRSILPAASSMIAALFMNKTRLEFWIPHDSQR